MAALLVGLVVALVGDVASAKGTRRALLVGVWAYERAASEGAWKNLGSRADVDAIRGVLIGHLGFAPSDVVALKTPAETTHRAIIDAFRKTLIDGAGPDDEIFFHYSGHGSQVPDDREVDGLAETLVPSDYVSVTDGANDIRDKEIEGLLAELAARGVRRVTLSFDCCHSGTITRSRMRGVRGAGRAYKARPRIDGGGAADGASGMVPPAVARDFVVLSACRPEELAGQRYDDAGQVVGIYSMGLVRALSRATASTTWRDVYEILRESLAADPQTPQIEGAIDRLVFGGSAVAMPAYIAVRAEGDDLLLEAGRLQGVGPGTTVDVYAPGTRDFTSTKPIVSAEVTQAGLATSTLRLGQRPAVALGGGRARIRRQVLPETRMRLDARALSALPEGPSITRDLRALPMVELTQGGTCDLAVVAGTGGLRLERSDGAVVAVLPADGHVVDAMRVAVEGEARRRFIAGLSNDAQDALSVRMRLVQVEPDLQDGHVVGVRRVIGPIADRAKAPAGTWVRVEVWNMGYQRIWLSLLDVMPDGAVNVLWPPPDRAHADERVENSIDERWVALPDLLIRLTPTRGKETFKLIATDRPVQLAPLLDVAQACQQTRGAISHPIARWLLDATLGLRSGRDAIEPAQWGTASVTVEVR